MIGHYTVYGLIIRHYDVHLYEASKKLCRSNFNFIRTIADQSNIACVKADQSNMKICTNFSPMNRDQPD